MLYIGTIQICHYRRKLSVFSMCENVLTVSKPKASKNVNTFKTVNNKYNPMWLLVHPFPAAKCNVIKQRNTHTQWERINILETEEKHKQWAGSENRAYIHSQPPPPLSLLKMQQQHIFTGRLLWQQPGMWWIWYESEKFYEPTKKKDTLKLIPQKAFHIKYNKKPPNDDVVDSIFKNVLLLSFFSISF